MLGLSVTLTFIFTIYFLLFKRNKNNALIAIVFSFTELLVGFLVFFSDFTKGFHSFFSNSINGNQGVVVFSLLTSFVFFAVFLLAYVGKKKPNEPNYFLLFAMKLVLMGIYSSTNAMILFFLWALLPIIAYSVFRDKSEFHKKIRLKMLPELIGSFMLLFFLVFLAEMFGSGGLFTYSLNHSNLLNIPFVASSGASPQNFLFLIVLLPLLLRVGFFPFHTFSINFLSSDKFVSASIVTIIYLLSSCFMLSHWVLPILFDAVDYYGLYLGGIAGAGVIYNCLIALGRKKIEAVIFNLFLAAVHIILMSLFMLSYHSQLGFYLLIISYLVGFIGAFYLSCNIASVLSHKDRWAACMCLLLISGLPVSGAFTGIVLSIVGLLNRGMAEASVFAGAILLFLVTVIIVLKENFLAKEKFNVDSACGLGRAERSVLLGLCILVLFVGLESSRLSQYLEAAPSRGIGGLQE